jgi:hypothetical protein
MAYSVSKIRQELCSGNTEKMQSFDVHTQVDMDPTEFIDHRINIKAIA